MPFIKLMSLLALHLLTVCCFSQTVTNQTELADAISNATPGTTIILADGTWDDTFIDIDKNGTASAPIEIIAETPGAVLMKGNSRVYMEGSYLTISGLVFQDADNLVTSGSEIEPVIELKNCDYCKIINNKIDSYNGTESQKDMKFKWVLADGQHNEIAYNSFMGKYGVGSIINDNRNSTAPDFLSIHHNYFADRTPINGVNDDNDQDAIRIGNSSTSLDDSFSEVYNNYFYNFFGEIEVISNKSGQNKYYNNTFRDYAGTLTLRHGNGCEVYGNYFFAEDNQYSGGVRVIGESHKIYNNYIEGVNSMKPDGGTSSATGGINVSNGRENSELNGYFQVIDSEVINNTFVNCDFGLRIGTKVKSDLDLEPENLIVANNIMYNTSVDPYQIITNPSGSSLSEGNITDVPTSDMSDNGNFHRLESGSSPIDAGLGNYYYLVDDILAGIREPDFDAGAEEYGVNGNELPYTASDVGVNIGFGAIASPFLSITPSMLNFDIDAGSLSFTVNSNVDWDLVENLSWLDFDITAGTGSVDVTVTVTENTSGSDRTASIPITEIVGGTGLSETLEIFQSGTAAPEEITIVGTTSLGMQIKDGISEENAYNDDFTNYWTGNPDTEPEVSITFDLACPHTLSEIGIHFWKADERTTTFSIATAMHQDGPFTLVIDTETSAETGATVETEQLFSLENTVGRYVKFIGIGNSSSSNWTSIANVNIYGNIEEDICLADLEISSIESTVNTIGAESFPVIFQVEEIAGIDSDAQLQIVIPKDPKIAISFDPTANSVMGQDVDNASWNFDDSGASYYILTKNSSLIAYTDSYISIDVAIDPQNQNGILNLPAYLDIDTEGELEVTNNVHTVQLDFEH